MKKIAIFTGLVASLVAAPSLAGTASLIDSFGSFPLDALVNQTKIRETCIATDPDPTDTSYICADGVRYLAYDGFITTIDFEFASGGSVLGIDAGDTEVMVEEKIRRTFGVTLSKSRVEDHNVYSTDMVSARTCGGKCAVFFVFDSEGVIAAISKQPDVPYI